MAQRGRTAGAGRGAAHAADDAAEMRVIAETGKSLLIQVRDPLAAAARFHAEVLPRVMAAAGERPACLTLVFEPADYAHEDWRRAAVATLAREHAPVRVNAVAGEDGAGVAATSAYLSNFLGVDTGLNATYATRSVFIGQSAGDSAGADVTYDGVNSDYYFDSVFMGFEAGKNATFADHSNFFGESAGLSATNANNANFFGQSAGLNATNAYESVFIGYRAGRSATNAASSTFLGSNAGLNASGAFGSFFASTNAGLNATNASESIFIGQQSGNGAIEANHSIFIGQSAGSSAANANNSIFIGNGAGVDDIVNNAASGSSILIGQNTSTGGFSNSIALGVYATNTASNQFMVGSTTRRIDNLVFNGGTGNTCSVNASTGITCSSDERLKTNITDIESALSDVMNLRTVTYNWKTDPDGKPMIGFIAQNLQQYFPQLVT